MLDVLSYVESEKAKLKVRADWLKSIGYERRMAIITDKEHRADNNSYIKSKVAFANEVGVVCDVLERDEVWEADVSGYHGVIVQYPFKGYDFKQFCEIVTKLIDPHKDIDGLGKYSRYRPCTPLGIYRYLEHLRSTCTLKGHVVVNIIGSGGLVGKPLAEMLLEDPRYTVCVTRSSTDDSTASMFRHLSKVIVCATPNHNLITCPSEDKVYVDCGCNLVNGKLLGNVSRDAYSPEMMITPVPGGVGKLTVLALFGNLLE